MRSRARANGGIKDMQYYFWDIIKDRARSNRNDVVNNSITKV